MTIAIFSAFSFEKPFLESANKGRFELRFIKQRLSTDTAILAKDCAVAMLFTSDDASAPVLETLAQMGVKMLALRSAGFNHVDLAAAASLHIQVARVPAYSPYAVAEHTVALMMALNRHLISAHNRIREGNFSLNGLVGFDMHEKTVGIAGTGKIGEVLCRIMHGFGCRILAYDLAEQPSLIKDYGVTYVSFKELCAESNIISLQLPLNESTRYIVNKESIEGMKKGVMLLNTSRGALVDTKAVIRALKQGQIGAFGMDVYEEENGLFFEDHSGEILQDDVIARLMTFRNVLITSHQAFLTDTALQNIADTSFANVIQYANKEPLTHQVKA